MATQLIVLGTTVCLQYAIIFSLLLKPVDDEVSILWPDVHAGGHLTLRRTLPTLRRQMEKANLKLLVWRMLQKMPQRHSRNSWPRSRCS